jgi:endonuclease/exonuclease/phosphatase family metal-dependent hydrolase
VAETVRDVVCVQEIHEQVHPTGQRHRIWKHLLQRLDALSLSSSPEAAERQGNLLAAMFAAGRLQAEADVDLVLTRYRAAWQTLTGSCPAGAACEEAA